LTLFYRKKCPKTRRPKALHEAAPATHLSATGYALFNPQFWVGTDYGNILLKRLG